jgi:hypothetical protein
MFHTKLMSLFLQTARISSLPSNFYVQQSERACRATSRRQYADTTIVVSRLVGCDTLSLDEYFPTFRKHATSLSRRKQAKNNRQEQRRASGGGRELNRARSLCNDVTSKNARTFINAAMRTSNRPTLTTVHTLSFVHRILCDLKLKWTSSKDNTAGSSQLRSLRG